MAPNFEVYYGEKGLWTRVVLYGNDGGDQAVLKGGADSVSLSILETSFVTSLLEKTSSDSILVSVADSSVLNTTGVSEIVRSDIIRPVLIETRAILVTFSSTDTILPMVSDLGTLGIAKSSDDTVTTILVEEVGSLTKQETTEGLVTSTVGTNV